jgi:hypothetical protein
MSDFIARHKFPTLPMSSFTKDAGGFYILNLENFPPPTVRKMDAAKLKSTRVIKSLVKTKSALYARRFLNELRGAIILAIFSIII